MLNKAVEFAKDSNDAVNTNGAPIINIKGVGIVYFLYLYETDIKETSLVYIGKSKRYLFKTRVRNHIFKKHPRTGSKLANVQKEIAKGNTIKMKYLKITPDSFRNTLEEELINHFRPSWNIQKQSKK